jgi:hypothetical protein
VAALLSAVFLASVLARQAWLVLPLAVGRLAAFAGRIRLRREASGHGVRLLAVARVALGLALPAALVPTGRGFALAVAAALAGELLDRASFYASLDVAKPGTPGVRS